MRLVAAILIALVCGRAGGRPERGFPAGQRHAAGKPRQQVPQAIASAGQGPQRRPQAGRPRLPRRRRRAQGHRTRASGRPPAHPGTAARALGRPAGGRGPPHPVRARLDRGVHRPDRRRAQREDRRRDQVVPAQPQIPGNRRAQYPGARAAGHRRQGASGPGRLDHGGRSGHRREARPAGQAGPEPDPGQDRHPLVVRAGTGAGRDLPHPGARPHARGGVRAAEESGQPQGRDQRAQRSTRSSCPGRRG